MDTFQDQVRAVHKAEGKHMVGRGENCWCGHGSSDAVEVEEFTFANTDGAHSIVDEGHQPECGPNCKAAHPHYHCRVCAAEGREHCCV